MAYRQRWLLPTLVFSALGIFHRTASADETAIPTPIPPAFDVRVHFTSSRPATILDPRSNRVVCHTPCTLDVVSGATFRTSLEGGEDSPRDVTIEAAAGAEQDVEIGRGGKGALVGGIVTAGVGGVLVLCGVALLAVPSMGHSSSPDDDESKGVAYGVMAGGAAAALVGLVVLGSRSHEATVRTRETPPPEEDHRGRRERRKWRDETAARSPSFALPPVAFQAGWTFRF